MCSDRVQRGTCLSTLLLRPRLGLRRQAALRLSFSARPGRRTSMASPGSSTRPRALARRSRPGLARCWRRVGRKRALPVRAYFGSLRYELSPTTLSETFASLSWPWMCHGLLKSARATLRRQLANASATSRPDALIITPESVSVLLSYASSHDQLRKLSCVIVDEWHELLGTKRGVLLELSLAHLRNLNPGLRCGDCRRRCRISTRPSTL